MKNAPVILLFKSHVDTYTRKDGTVVQAHEDKRQAAAEQKSGPEVKTMMSDGTYKQWKRAVPHKGKVNGWDHFHDQVAGRHVLMTSYNAVGFDTEHEAKEWAGKNKAKPKGDWNS